MHWTAEGAFGPGLASRILAEKLNLTYLCPRSSAQPDTAIRSWGEHCVTPAKHWGSCALTRIIDNMCR